MKTAQPGSHQRRYRLIRVAKSPSDRDAFAEQVRVGLGARPKRLACRFFYDREGAALFEEICRLPEYYLTEAEREILTGRAQAIAAHFPHGTTLIELGSGSASKTRVLIDAFLARHGRLHYVPVDVSHEMLESSSLALLADRPTLKLTAVAADYQAILRALRVRRAHSRLILWLGSSIGNYSRPRAAAFLGRVRSVMTSADRLLVGIDLRKDRGSIERAYDDNRGVTARFNRNLLARINRELGGEFVLERFAHRVSFDEDEGRLSMHLVSQGEQSVAIRQLRLAVDFSDGEAVHTEDSYKYAPAEIDGIAALAGLALRARWLDGRGRFSLNLLAPA